LNYVADKRYYTNGPLDAPDSQIVEEDSEDARYLLIAPGQEMPEAEAIRWGLIVTEATEDAAEETK
jgi:hypothetical protein